MKCCVIIDRQLDHKLGNVSLLLMPDAQGKRAKVLDDDSEIGRYCYIPGFFPGLVI